MNPAGPSNLATILVLSTLGLAIALFIAGLFMLPILRVWFGGALSAFISGMIEGAPIGTPTGAAVAAADGQIFADLDSKHLAIEVAHLLAVPVLTGLADIRTYQKSYPFPNIFAPAAKRAPAIPSTLGAPEAKKPTDPAP